MDLRQIRYFIAIVDFGSLTKAASHLNVAQPALSLQLSNLEAEYKTKLLLRTPKGVVLTELGRILYRHGRLILKQIEDAREEMQTGVQSLSGVVSIGLPSTVIVPLGVPLVRAVREAYPGIRLQLLETLSGHLSEMLANNRLDFAVLFRDAESRTISVSPLFRERLYLFGDGGLSESVREWDRCSISDIEGVPLVLPSDAHDLRRTVELAFAQCGVEPNIVADIDSTRTMLSIASDGIACAILPLSTVPKRVLATKPPIHRLIEPAIQRTISLCRLESSPLSPAAAAVEKIFRETTARLITNGDWPGVDVAV